MVLGNFLIELDERDLYEPIVASRPLQGYPSIWVPVAKHGNGGRNFSFQFLRFNSVCMQGTAFSKVIGNSQDVLAILGKGLSDQAVWTVIRVVIATNRLTVAIV